MPASPDPVPPTSAVITSVIDRSIVRILDHEAGVRAILLKGSRVRGDAGPHSDIDLDVLIDGPGAPDESRYAAWFDSGPGRLQHVSVAIHSWDQWWADVDEPADWAMGLAALEVHRLLWARDPEATERLSGPGSLHPPAGPELEDCISDLDKVRNALLRGDDLGVRLAAQGVGRLCPTVLAILPDNQLTATPVTSPRTALDAILALPLVPDGYRDDLLLCLGLSDVPKRVDALADAAERLVMGAITLLEEHLPPLAEDAPPRFEEGLDTALANRTLRAYVQVIHLSTGN